MRRLSVIFMLSLVLTQWDAFAQSDVDKFFKNAAKVQKDKAVVEDEKPKEEPKKEPAKPATPKEEPKPTKPTAPVTGLRIQTPHQNIVVKLIKMSRIDSRVILDFTVCNTSNKDLEFSLCGGVQSTAFDNVGNKYAKTITCSISSGGHSSYFSDSLFPSNVPIKCQIVIDEVEPDATTLTRINWVMSCSKMEIYNKPIIISNVSIRQ